MARQLSREREGIEPVPASAREVHQENRSPHQDAQRDKEPEGWSHPLQKEKVKAQRSRDSQSALLRLERQPDAGGGGHETGGTARESHQENRREAKGEMQRVDPRHVEP